VRVYELSYRDVVSAEGFFLVLARGAPRGPVCVDHSGYREPVGIWSKG
jgi:hypothetical protein